MEELEKKNVGPQARLSGGCGRPRRLIGKTLTGRDFCPSDPSSCPIDREGEFSEEEGGT